MSWSIWLLAVLVAVGFFLWTRRGAGGIKQISGSALLARLKDQPRSLEIVDVREPFEFSGGHIAQAKNIPLGQLEAKLKSLSRDKDIVFVCRSGNRSMMAARQAKKAGIASVQNLTGGMSRWTGPVKK